MCGLAGVFLDGGPADGQGTVASIAARMGATLRHRGPDADGVWVDEEAGVALAFRRLAILDLSPTGDQPMRSVSGRFCVVFNGEIYNYRDLRKLHEEQGTRFAGTSDTEVLLAGMERWGIREAIQRAAGMFALAVWDSSRRELTLARDRLGIKPLFVAQTRRGIAFGSELRAVMQAPGVDRTVSPASVAAYLRYLYVPEPRSILANVSKLEPGQMLMVRHPTAPLSPENYWSLTEVAKAGMDQPFTGDEHEAADELAGLLRTVVRQHLQSDVPLGAFLSGGIDSSTVVALMQAERTDAIKSYCIAFDDPAHDEARFAAAVARHLGTDHHEIPVTGGEALDLVPKMASIFDEPFADASQVPAALLCSLARRDVTVALSGEGGDEVFGGYNRYVYADRLFRRVDRLPRALASTAGAALSLIRPGVFDRLGAAIGSVTGPTTVPRLFGEKIGKLSEVLRQPGTALRYRALVSACQDPSDLLAAKPVSDWDPLVGLLERNWPASHVDRLMLADQSTYLPGDQLTKADRVSMAASLELRVPLLDHRVVELSWRFPTAYKIRGTQGKAILRQVLHRFVPMSLVDRPKVGFTVPLAGWLKGPLRSWASDLLAPAAVRREGILDPSQVEGMWKRFLAGRTGLALGLWAVLMLRSWEDTWLGAPPKLEPARG